MNIKLMNKVTISWEVAAFMHASSEIYPWLTYRFPADYNIPKPIIEIDYILDILIFGQAKNR